MAADVRFIIKCTQFHHDGNTDPVEVKTGEVLSVNENQWLRLKQSAPFSFMLIERRAPYVDPVDIPSPTQAEPESGQNDEPLDITEAVKKQTPKKRKPKKVAAQDAEA